MWNLSLPWWEFIVRALVVYFFLLVILRLTGKRQIGQMSPFDLVLLLVLSNAVQNSMNGGDNTVLGGLILVVTLVGCNALLGYITSKSKTVERIVEGEPAVLIYKGKMVENALEEQGLSISELDGALRMAGCQSVSEVHLATLEVTGQISIVREDTDENKKPRVQRISQAHRRKGRRSGYGA